MSMIKSKQLDKACKASIVCPQCGHEITEIYLTRCPRCFKSLIPLGCANCNGCGIGRKCN